MTEPATLKAALDYAARGWQNFPLKPQSKEPATRRGFYDATTDPATLHRWFGRGFPYNVAIRTGTPSGVFILDIDGNLGATNLAGLIVEHEALPATRTSTTGKGRHLWFRAECEIPCSTGKIAAGVDVRGDGGYVLVPPSIHPNGRRYEWSVDSADEIAVAPAWLVELARKKSVAPISEQALAAIRARRPAGKSPDAYGRAALEYEIESLATASPGSRNHALNRAAFSLFQLVAGGELDEQEVIARLIQACHANRLMTDPDDGPRKVWNTIQSGRRAGMQHPRSRPGAT